MKRNTAFFLFLLALVCAGSVAAETIVGIDRIREGQLEMVGFDLPRDTDVKLEAVGLRNIPGRDLFVMAWLIDHESRKPLWVMKRSECERYEDSRALLRAVEELRLPRGQYELYLSASPNSQYWADDFGEGLSRTLHKVFGMSDKRSRHYRGMIRDCYVKIDAEGLSRDEVAEVEIDGALRNAFLQFNRVRDEKLLSRAFELREKMNVRIYAFAEITDRDDPAVDAGWIVDNDTRERVWEMTWRNTKPAGGGRKNRKFNQDVELPAGSYTVYYATDDSHSWERFNVAPPLDPPSWGLSLLPGEGASASDFRLLDEMPESEPLIDITRVRDDDFHERTFRLDRPATLHVLCVGEYGSNDREFVDFGWITDLDSGRRVWEMTRRNTTHAGGGEKNRMFDGLVELPAGTYTAGYLTDDSHAFRDWNDAPPFQPRSWGLTINPGPGCDARHFELLEGGAAELSPNVLARIVRVRNREHRREAFTLDSAAEVHIHAIGEWDEIHDEFADYGWIEDDQGRVIWEMTRRNTRFAGGARKNRAADATIDLEPGDYEVHYRTDDSHAFNAWNADRPRDPRNWGITIRTAED